MHPLKSQLSRAFPTKQKPKARKHTQGDGNANHKPKGQKPDNEFFRKNKSDAIVLFYFI